MPDSAHNAKDGSDGRPTTPDRLTTPGVGDDPNATLPEPRPPAPPIVDLGRTLPGGAAMVNQWPVARPSRPVPGNDESGVHTVSARRSAGIGSDRPTPLTGSLHTTLHDFGALRSPPPRNDHGDKHWIGSSVDRNLGTTQRTFTVPPPAEDTPTIAARSTRGHNLSLGQTLRVSGAPAASMPPPAQGTAARDASTPITPSQTVRISPEIAIAPRTRLPESARPVESPTQAAHATQATHATQAPAPPPPPAAAQGSQAPQATPTRQAPQPTAAPREQAERSVQQPQPRAARRQVTSTQPSRQTILAVAGVSLALLAITAWQVAHPAQPQGPAPHIVMADSAAVANTQAPSTAAAPGVSSNVEPGVAPVADPRVDPRTATEISTDPPGAEIILRGALVANTPAHVVRPRYEALYLVKLRGYQPQLVALSPHSPPQIHIALLPLSTPDDPTPPVPKDAP